MQVQPVGRRQRGAAAASAPADGARQDGRAHRTATFYVTQKEKIYRFLSSFVSSGPLPELDGDRMDDTGDGPFYLGCIRQVAAGQRVQLPVYVEHLKQHFDTDELVNGVQGNTARYVELFSEQVDIIMQQEFADEIRYDPESVEDVLSAYRMQSGDSSAFPRALVRRYELFFVSDRASEVLALRDIRAQHVGGLVKTRGIVVRVSEVMPLVTVATYVCDRCGYETYQEIFNREFMPRYDCQSERCNKVPRGQKKKRGTLHMQMRGSKFVRFQEIRLQELPEEVPVGHIPRSISCHLRGDMTRRVTPGDVATVDGVYLPAPYAGFKALRAGLIANTHILVMSISKNKKTYASIDLGADLIAQIRSVGYAPEAYDRLALSIAPEIYGHLDVKKALLLMMVSGVTRKQEDGMTIRGDINICLMGDPGVAKSQLLKHIAKIAPRGVYTSGKGSSGVGLTAAVLKDPTSGEFTLEGGSLVLADLGICAIDEFDKMADADRTAIHEVMEQQSISIAKAGITTTLNARTAILAAANPAYGRYNTKRTPSENINLPAALLSRFDLLFLLLDKPDMERDIELARHITHVHRFEEAPELEFEPLSSDFLRSYVAYARRFEPYVTPELEDHIVSAYVNMRQEEAAAQDNATGYTTARTLLAILRLAQAMARLRFSNSMDVGDVDEAIRLINMSKFSLTDQQGTRAAGVDTMSAIFNVIRDYSRAQDSPTVNYADVLSRIVTKGYRQDDLNKCLEEYEMLSVWIVSDDKSSITFL